MRPQAIPFSRTRILRHISSARSALHIDLPAVSACARVLADSKKK